MWYGVLADLVVVVHLAYVAFVVVGQVLILAGAALGWRWIRNLRFRVAHLAAITLVALEAVSGIVCPLTVWENRLRALAGQPGPDGTFVTRYVHAVLFFELPPWVFTTVYVCFALAVVATMWMVPPQRAGGTCSFLRFFP